MSEQRFFGGLLPRVRVPKRRTTEAQRARRRGATSAVPSVPLWFKRLDKNVVLLGVLRVQTRTANRHEKMFRTVVQANLADSSCQTQGSVGLADPCGYRPAVVSCLLAEDELFTRNRALAMRVLNSLCESRYQSLNFWDDEAVYPLVTVEHVFLITMAKISKKQIVNAFM